MIDTSSQSSLINRMIRAARLDPNLYEEVEADQNATNDALLVVVIAAVATGIGAGLSAVMRPSTAGGPGIGSIIFSVVWAIIGWVIWSYVTYFIGTRLFSGRATPSELLRTIGFAQSPGVLSVLTFIPVLGGIISLIVGIWVLIAGVVAVRQALDFDTGKAILTTIIGWLVFIVVPIVLLTIFFGGAAAISGLAGT
jgi:hypothetical protein